MTTLILIYFGATLTLVLSSDLCHVSELFLLNYLRLSVLHNLQEELEYVFVLTIDREYEFKIRYILPKKLLKWIYIESP